MMTPRQARRRAKQTPTGAGWPCRPGAAPWLGREASRRILVPPRQSRGEFGAGIFGRGWARGHAFDRGEVYDQRKTAAGGPPLVSLGEINSADRLRGCPGAPRTPGRAITAC